MSLDEAVSTITGNIINPAIILFFVLGLVVFAFGVVQFINASRSGDSRGMETGKKHMIWGIIGFAIMISTFGIINLVSTTIGGL